MRHRWLGLVVALAVAGLFGSALVGSVSDPAPGEPSDGELIDPDGVEGALWPYTSRSRSVADRTLAINVVIRGGPERVRRALESRSQADWGTVSDEGVVTDSPWIPARGAARYTYVAADRNGSGRWVEATYQLGVGTYLGHRTHIRAYPARAGNWTALQAHTEYWDWYRLRHTVTGIDAGARFVERDLRDEPFVGTVSREYHGLDGGGSDGWLTVIELVPAAVVGMAFPVGVWRRESLREVALPVALAAVPLGVRGAGIVAERLFPSADPKLFAALLYPVVALGPLAVVGWLARGRQPDRAALLAAVGLGVGIVLDFGAVSVQVTPIRLALHRIALVSALAAVAFGVARADRRTVAVGLGAWIGVLAGALLGVV